MRTLSLLAHIVMLVPLITSCFSGPSFFKQSGSQQLAANITMMAPLQQDNDGVRIAQFSSSQAVTQEMVANPTSEISGTTISFPPGSLAVDTSISLEAGSSIISPVLVADLGLGTATELSPATTAVNISSQTPMDALSPFTIAIVLPSASLTLTDPYAHLIAAYKIRREKDGLIIAGIIPRSSISVQNGKAVFQVSEFGTYQLAWATSTITERKEVITHTPILTRSEEKKLPNFSLLAPDLEVNATLRSWLATLKSEGQTDLSNCLAQFDEDQYAPHDLVVRDMTSQTLTGHATKGSSQTLAARISCHDKYGRNFVSPWSQALSLDALKAEAEGLPTASVGSPRLAFSVKGTAVTSFTALAVATGQACITTASSSWQSELQKGVLDLPAVGHFDVCIFGRDRWGNVQKEPTRYPVTHISESHTNDHTQTTPPPSPQTGPVITAITLAGAASDSYINEMETNSTQELVTLSVSSTASSTVTTYFHLAAAGASCPTPTNSNVPRGTDFNLLSDGLYKICIRAVDNSGQESTAESPVITKDTTAPTLASFVTTPGAGEGGINVSLTLPSGTTDHVKLIIMRSPGSAYPSSGPSDCNSGAPAHEFYGPFINGQTIAATDSNLTPGHYYAYTACAQDAAGNRGAALMAPSTRAHSFQLLLWDAAYMSGDPMSPNSGDINAMTMATWSDASGNGNDGIASGFSGMTDGWEGDGGIPSPYRVEFSGSGTYVQAPTSLVATTVILWFKARSTLAGPRHIIDMATQWGLSIDDKHTLTARYNGHIFKTTTQPEAWNHFVGTFDQMNNKVHVYLNGVKFGETSSGMAAAPSIMTVGKSTSDYYDGALARVELRGNYLTQAQVADDYTARVDRFHALDTSGTQVYRVVGTTLKTSGGDNVYIYGRNFQNPSVEIGGISCTIIEQSDNFLAVLTPTLGHGSFDLRINSGSDLITLANAIRTTFPSRPIGDALSLDATNIDSLGARGHYATNDLWYDARGRIAIRQGNFNAGPGALSGWTGDTTFEPYALRFDAIHEVLLGHMQNITALSLWVKPGVYDAMNRYLLKFSNAPNHYIKLLNGQFSIAWGSSSVTTSGPPVNGAWHHLYVHANGSQLEVYLDGLLVTNGPSMGASPPSLAFLGNDGLGSSTGFIGEVGEIDLFSTNPGGAAATQLFNDSKERYHSEQNSHVIFVSSASYTGNFGGETFADSECQNQASSAGMPGVWKAILSSWSPANTRILINGPVYNKQNVIIAPDATSFWNGAHLDRIDFTETGSNLSPSALVWTGSTNNGGIDSQNCSNFTDSSGALNGAVGDPSSISGSWLNDGTASACDVMRHFYCISQ